MVTFNSTEDKYFAVKAALLDSRAYVMTAISGGGNLDVTVPSGKTWYVTNAFSVFYNVPSIFAQDGNPNIRRSGFVRELDTINPLVLPAGTRIQNNNGINTAYIYYCDPSLVWDLDPRYLNPKQLYYDRLDRLTTIPLSEVILECTGGGALTDVVNITIPPFNAIMVSNVSVYDTCWMTIGWPDGELNVLSEINNSHAVRFARANVMQPIPYRGGPVVITLQKGSNADQPNSTDPAIAYPIKGSCSMVYQILPSDF